VVREGLGKEREMTQALYAHMNNKIFKKRENRFCLEVRGAARRAEEGEIT
jgi:hypothetical protein